MSQKVFLTYITISLLMLPLMIILDWPWALLPFGVGFVLCAHGMFLTRRALKKKENK